MATQQSEIQRESNPAEQQPGNKEVPEEESSEGMATNKASRDVRKTTKEVHEDRSSQDMATPLTDLETRSKQMTERAKSEVRPKAVIDETSRQLFEAVVKGDWKTIKEKLNKDPAAMTAKIMTIETRDFTMLDIAIMAAQDQLVENLVKHFLPKYKDLDPNRAFHYAARGGRTRIVKALINRVDAGPEIIGNAFASVIQFAPMQKEVIWYLARRIKSFSPSENLFHLLGADHLDICLYVVDRFPGLVTSEGIAESLLYFLSLMPYSFRSGAKLNFWEKSIYKCIPLCLVDPSFDYCKDTKMAQVRALNQFKVSLWNLVTIAAPFIKRSGELKLRHECSFGLITRALDKMKDWPETLEVHVFLLTSGVVLDSATRGIFEIVDLCLRRFPELMWDDNFAKSLIVEVVKGRHVELFRLVNAHNPTRYLANNPTTNVEVMEAVTTWSSRCVSPDVSGAAFLMQRELQWFQVVEVGKNPSIKWLKFLEHRKTYWEAFVEQREELLKEARRWVKDTSSSFSLVATLIITIAFAAAFTVPGGNSDNNGIPIFLEKGSFMVFAVADALALFFSVTATLMFLAILTSRYTIEDFLHSLPRKMVMGLTFLFLSLASMLVAFGSALTIILSGRLKWIYIPITLLAAFPVILFALLQLPLYIEMVESTYWPRLNRPLKLWK